MLRKEYLPAGPSESARVRDIAAEHIRQLRQTEEYKDKANFMKYLQDVTNEIVGIRKKEPLPPSRSTLSIESYSTPPIAPVAPIYITPEMRQPSMLQLDKMRSVRQSLQNQSGIRLSAPPIGSTFASTVDHPPFKSSVINNDVNIPFAGSTAVSLPYEGMNKERVPAGIAKFPENDFGFASSTVAPVASSAPQSTIYDSSSDSDDGEQSDDEDDEGGTEYPADKSADSEVPAVSEVSAIPAPVVSSVATATKAPEVASVNSNSASASSAVSSAEAAAAAMYAKKLEQLLAERDLEIQTLRANQLKIMEAQLAQINNAVAPVPAPVPAVAVAPPLVGPSVSSTSVLPPPAPMVAAQPQPPQEQHIHIHNHFPESSRGSSSSSSSSSSRKTDSKSSAINDSPVGGSGKENDDKLLNKSSEPVNPVRYQYPYEVPYYAPRPQQTQQPSVGIHSTGEVRRAPEVEIVYKPHSVLSNSSTNRVPADKGTTLVERALDLSGLTLERLRELTGRY